MTKVELNILLESMAQMLWLVRKIITSTSDANINAIMVKLANALKPIYDELLRLRQTMPVLLCEKHFWYVPSLDSNYYQCKNCGATKPK